MFYSFSHIDLRPLQEERISFSVGWGEITQTTFPGECRLTIFLDKPNGLFVEIDHTRDGIVVRGEEGVEKALKRAYEEEENGICPLYPGISEMETVLSIIDAARS